MYTRHKRKALKIRIRMFLAVFCCLIAFSHPAYAKTNTTLTAYDTLMSIGDSIDLQDVVSVTGGYDGKLQFSITQSTYAQAGSIVGTRLYVYKSGRITIKVTAPETTKYSAAEETFYINVMGKTLSFQPIDRTVSLSSGSVDLNPFTSLPEDYTGTPTFTSSDRTVATISGSAAKLLAAGTTQITVTAPATETYAAAKKTFALTVTAQATSLSVKNATVSADVSSINLNSYVSAGDYPGTLQYTITQGTSIASVSGSTLTITGSGTVGVKVTAPATGGYSAAEKSFTVTVTPVTALTGFGAASVTMGGTLNLNNLITKNAKYTGTITYSVTGGPGTISGSTLTPTGAGTIRVTAKTPATSIFSASEVSTSITVTRRTTTLTASSVTKYRDDAPIRLSSLVSITSGYDGSLRANVTGSSVSVSGDTISFTGIGTSTITVTAPQTSSCESAQTTLNITVIRHPTSLTAADITKYRNDIPLSLSSLVNATAGYNGALSATVEGNSVTISGGVLNFVRTGASTIHVTAPQTETYDGATTSFRVNVILHETGLTTRDIVLSRTASSARLADYYTLTGSAASPAFRITDGTGVVTITNGTVRADKIGTAKISVTVPENAGYAGASAVITVTVAGEKTQITNKGEIRTEYGAQSIRLTDHITITPGYDGEISVRVNGDAVRYQNGMLIPSIAGDAIVTVTAPSTIWYEGTSTSFSVHVAGKSPELTALQKEYSVDYGKDTFKINEMYKTAGGYDGTVTAAVTKGRDVIGIRQGEVYLIGAGTATVTLTAGATSGYLSEQREVTFVVNPISPKLQTEPALVFCGAEPIDLTDYIRFTADSEQKPEFKIEEGEKSAALSDSHLKVSESATISIRVTLPAKGPYDTESAVIPVTVAELVAMDTEEPATDGYYNTPREFHILFTGSNFRKADYPDRILSGKGGSFKAGEWESENGKTILPLSFEEDGEYTFRSPAGDVLEHFVIDRTAPKVHLEWDKLPENERYFNETVTATIHVLDTYPSEIKPLITGEYQGEKLSPPSISNWEKDEDGIHADITLSKEGIYRITLTPKDLAGNKGEEFQSEDIVIDLTRPDVILTGLEEGKIYKTDQELRASYTDENASGQEVNITLSGARHTESILTGKTNGEEWLYIIRTGERSQDDAYTLVATVKDLAGNEARKELRFGINRFGSEFTWNNPQSVLKDVAVLITEQNVSKITTRTVTVGCNGRTYQLNEETDYTVSHKDEDGMNYLTYQIPAEIFKEDGYYEILISTTDEAENKQSNAIKECPVRFLVDRTDPDCLFAGIKDNASYSEESIPFSVHVSDNVGMDHVTVYANDTVLASFDADEIEQLNGKLLVTVKESNGYQSILAEAVDAAGNTKTAEIRILVATNPWIRFVNNTPLLAGTITVILTLAGGIIFIFVKKRRRVSE